jgi:adenine-specific DNA-methyltransferase
MPKRKTKPKGPKPIKAITHSDKRTNIPTADAQDFVSPETQQPVELRYPRDPSLDPQLVWKGKDELDGEDLIAEAPPIYIQEKIDPRVLVENLRRTAERPEDEPELQLFESFDGLDELDLVEFYRHDANWSNRMILGDSLNVMASLAEREALRGKVQMVYFDPPYGIDFKSNWQASVRERDVTDGRLKDISREVEQIKAFRDTWRNGVNSYLTYLRDRITVARDLLTDSGSLFVQIGQDNVHLVRAILDEVFGADHLIAQITFATSTGTSSNTLASVADYILWYGRSAGQTKFRQLYALDVAFNAVGEDVSGQYETGDMTSQEPSESRSIPLVFHDDTFSPSSARHWSFDPELISRIEKADRAVKVSDSQIRWKQYERERARGKLTNVWSDTQFGAFSKEKIYVVQTHRKVVQRCILMATDPGDLVLDPTCGSGTTAVVAEEWGRRWITIDTSRVALALARTRLMGAQFPYFILADSDQQEPAGSSSSDAGSRPQSSKGDLANGFAYKAIPHVKLSTIVENEEIDEIWERWNPQISATLRALNESAGRDWREWEVPLEPDEAWSDEALAAFSKWRKVRRGRQKEMDESIKARAEGKPLYDQPREDRKVARVAGPFTVESLSPHRSLAFAGSAVNADGARNQDAKKPIKDGPSVNGSRDDAQFEQMILENLRAAGIQTGEKEGRISFESLEPYAATHIQAIGEREPEGDDSPKRVGITIGPQYSTVGPSFVKDAAREANKAGDIDLLCILAFAFDPQVVGASEAEYVTTDDGFASVAGERQLGKVPILLVRMNADLVMGDELKKTGAGNLFTVFGEPDIEILEEGDELRVVLNGVDVYDPNTGEVRSNDTDQIALWMIDTDYNGESFFVRHCYFTGGQDPYKRLKTTLKAEIDADMWATLCSTESRPFQRPESGKIAVKVINDYGDEVLKVFDLDSD